MDNKVRLRDCCPDDFTALISWVSDHSSLRQWGGSQFVYPLDQKQLESYINQGSSRIFMAILEDIEPGVGHIALKNINRRAGFARLSNVIIAPEHRGRGLGYQMVCQALSVGFAEIGLHRIDLGVYDFNTSAIACYQKAGFVQEGVLREAMRAENGYWNLLQMSILEQEWGGDH